jgi:hypothetical protein
MDNMRDQRCGRPAGGGAQRGGHAHDATLLRRNGVTFAGRGA